MRTSVGGHRVTTRAMSKVFWASLPIRSPYLGTLDQVHQHLRPRTYVEVGVSKGTSLTLVLPGTTAIGIDPAADVRYPLRSGTRIFHEPSDEFFERHDLRALLGDRLLDLAFIDGMHLFEFALRDFMHLERFAHPETTILIHDCYPISEETATRERQTPFWSGDIWRLIVCLKEWRPELKINVVDVFPTGLGVITGLDPNSRVLDEHYDEIVRRAINIPYEYFAQEGKDQVLSRVPSDWSSVRRLLPARAFRADPLQLLPARRAASSWVSKAAGSIRDLLP